MEGWVDGWAGVKTILRTAYTNQKGGLTDLHSLGRCLVMELFIFIFCAKVNGGLFNG